MLTSTRPTTRDRALVAARDGTFLTCWVETVGNIDRWLVMSPDGVRHIGPLYAGQNTLTTIRELVDAWWQGSCGRRLEFPDRQVPMLTSNDVAASAHARVTGASGTEHIATA